MTAVPYLDAGTLRAALAVRGARAVISGAL
jgi:hypothetical protein